MQIATRTMYLNADKTQIVGEGKEAAYLLAREGTAIQDIALKDYGHLLKKSDYTEPETATAEAAPAAENAPVEGKSASAEAKASATKGRK